MIQAYNNIDTSRQKSRQDDIFSRLYPFSATCATCKIHQISKFLVTVSPSKVKTKKAWLKPKLLCIHSYYSRLCQLLPPWRQSSSGTSDSGWQAGCSRSILVNLLTCVIPGQGNSKILNLIKKSGSFDTPSFYKYQTMRKQVRATLFDPSLLIDRLSMKSDVPKWLACFGVITSGGIEYLTCFLSLTIMRNWNQGELDPAGALDLKDAILEPSRVTLRASRR